MKIIYQENWLPDDLIISDAQSQTSSGNSPSPIPTSPHNGGVPPGCSGLIPIHDLSVWLNLSTSYLYKLVCSRQIPFVKVGARVLFDTERIKLWLNDKAVEPIYVKTRRAK
jgi:excisionase family DNA binding protein